MWCLWKLEKAGNSRKRSSLEPGTARPCPGWAGPVRPVPGPRENKCVWFSATRFAVTCDSSCRKGMQCPRNVQGGVLAAWWCRTTGWGLLMGDCASRALWGVQECVQAQAEDPPELVGGPGSAPAVPGPPALWLPSRAGGQGDATSPMPGSRARERCGAQAPGSWACTRSHDLWVDREGLFFCPRIGCTVTLCHPASPQAHCPLAPTAAGSGLRAPAAGTAALWPPGLWAPRSSCSLALSKYSLRGTDLACTQRDW